MTDSASPHDAASDAAARELAQVLAQTDAARVVLIRILQEVVEAEAQLGNHQAPPQLVEANQNLVIAALNARGEAEAAAQARDDVARSARIDSLTELPNRLLLLDRFARAISSAQRNRTGLALLFLDLDDFKQINDTFGHATGDEVLKRVARCLVGVVRETDTVSRHGGDEFLILLAEVADPADASLVADKVIAALRACGAVGKHVAELRASIGISLYPDDGRDAETLIAHADAAMYRAKREGLGRYTFHAEPVTGAPDIKPMPRESRRQLGKQHALALAEHRRRHAELQEGNEHLVLAALGAQELQAAAEQAQRRQTEFLAVVAHELRNPLAPIRLAATLLGRIRTDEPLLPRARAIIERQVAHMTRLVSDLVDVSRVNTGKFRLERRDIDLSDVIEAALDACRPTIQSRHQHLVTELPEGAIEMHGDPVRLTQVLGNLLDNASKYTHENGHITVAVTLEDEAVVIAVSDDGIGVTAQALPDIFEPFVQDPHAIGFNGVGLGIGLTVVRELVEAHGGKVTASSAGRGLGSRFVVTLPVLVQPPAADAEPANGSA